MKRRADAKQIKKAYREAALKHHPDKVPPEEREKAEAEFMKIAEAYEILSDDEQRAKVRRCCAHLPVLLPARLTRATRCHDPRLPLPLPQSTLAPSLTHCPCPDLCPAFALPVPFPCPYPLSLLALQYDRGEDVKGQNRGPPGGGFPGHPFMHHGGPGGGQHFQFHFRH